MENEIETERFMKKITFHQIVWYFFVFSIFGMIMENIVCLVTTGKIESRKGFIIGPFCPIYGFGAILLIYVLKAENKWYRILFYGTLTGTAFEYISSFTMQALYGVKFWNYEKYFLNVNGRTALLYAVSWGILSLVLMYIAKPMVDKFIDKYKSKSLDYIMLFFMVINCCLTYNSIQSYAYRASLKYSGIDAEYNGLMSNEIYGIIKSTLRKKRSVIIYFKRTEKDK